MKGFGASLAPRDIIKNLRANVSELTPANIEETVHNQRAYWDDDYGKRLSNTCILQECLFNPLEASVTTEFEDFAILNPKLKGMKMHLMAQRGYWSLFIQTMPSGKKEFSFNVFCGNSHVWHPLEAKNNIVHHLGEDIYHQWKKVVLEDWKVQRGWLISQARKHCPGFRAWSVTANDSSTRLMKSCPRVTVIEPGVGFLFL
jgi:hypothetical protein